MKQRTKLFALGVIQLVESLPKERTAEVLGRQLLRSGTSIGSNYRSACRSRSIADFISKMGIVEEESDESLYWMELLIQTY
jgi:four helix bundle protein